MRIQLQPYIHQCVIGGGDLAGNTLNIPVTSSDIEHQVRCGNCDELLCTPEQATAHIYSELIDEGIEI